MANENLTTKQKLGYALMGFGGGLTGKDVVGNFILSQQRQVELDKMKQEMENRKKFQDWFLNQSGGQTLGGMSNGMGFTGLSYDPVSGETKMSFGQTPESKQRFEQAKTNEKAKRQDESEYLAGKSLIDEIKKNWLKTNPPKVTNDGKFSPVGAIKGLGLPAYGAEQWVGSKLQMTKNQRADNQYIRFVNSLRSRLAKGTIGKDVGNLSEYEQRVATAGVPSGTHDTYENGIGIIDNLQNMLLEMKKARSEGYKNLDEKMQKEGMVLTQDKAKEYLTLAKGDKELARQQALRDGWYF